MRNKYGFDICYIQETKYQDVVGRLGGLLIL